MSKYFNFKLRIILIGFALACGAVHAEVFKWVDANGKIHYSDRKIDSSAEKLSISTGKTSKGETNTDSEQRLANQNKYVNYLQSERLERQEKRDQQKQQQTKQKQYCASLKDQLISFTEDQARWYVFDDATGERRFVTDAELNQRKQELQSEIKTNCS